MKTKLKTVLLYVISFTIICSGLAAFYNLGDNYSLKYWVLVIITVITLTNPALNYWEPKVKRLLKIVGVKYKGKQYKILHKAKYKNPTTRQWEDVIVYQGECGVYVREEKEFNERFKEV